MRNSLSTKKLTYTEETMDIKRLFDLLDNLKENYPDCQDVITGKKNGEWVSYSTEDYIDYANKISLGLLDLGIEKGDKIISVVSNNRAEWNFIDMGISQIGAVHVPVYPNLSEAEYDHIFTHSDAKVLFVSDTVLYRRVKASMAKCNNIKNVYTFDKVEGAEQWENLMINGMDRFDELIRQVYTRKRQVKPDDVVSIIYTSGTTGVPKGVMLTHNNFLSNAWACREILTLTNKDRVLSFLPLCHVFERMVNYVYQTKAIRIVYAENMGTIAENLRKFKINGFMTVPRLLEKVHDNIISKGKDLSSFKKMVFFWAVRLAYKYRLNKNSGWYKLKQKLADKLVYSQWRKALGDNLKLVITGGAACQKRLCRFYWAAGIELQEGYGLTETSPVIAVNRKEPNQMMFGTVGPVVENIEVKIAEDGEILVQGPTVMKGYYKDEAGTSEVIADNWFHTGDIGVLVDNAAGKDYPKFLKITDRKKSIFKTSNGKYITPQPIENMLVESIFIEQAMLVGADEKYASAIISPNFNYLHFWASKHKVHFRDNQELVDHPEVNARIKRELNEINKELAEHEKIKKFKLVVDEWSPQTGELSATLKLKRKIVLDKYKDIIDELYEVKSSVPKAPKIRVKL